MKLWIKIISWPIFLISVLACFIAISDLSYYGTESWWEISEWILFIGFLFLAIGLGHTLLKEFLKKIYNWFSALTFERKMMLIVVLAILLAVGMYTWSTIKKQNYYQETQIEKRVRSR